MLDIVTTTFYIKSPEFIKKDFEQHASDLFDEWEAYVGSVLNLADYSLSLVVEEGSIKGKGKVTAAAIVLYFGIGNYGDFVSGLHTIRDQASYLGDALFNQAKRSFSCSSSRGNSKQSSGEIYYLNSLFERVRSGATTPEAAAAEVKERWKDEEGAERFLRDISRNLADAQRYPEQLNFSEDEWDDCPGAALPKRSPKPRIPRGPEIFVPQHYRIEISRPSKGEKKKMKIMKI
jgi:hypothetical protein